MSAAQLPVYPVHSSHGYDTGYPLAASSVSHPVLVISTGKPPGTGYHTRTRTHQIPLHTGRVRVRVLYAGMRVDPRVLSSYGCNPGLPGSGYTRDTPGSLWVRVVGRVRHSI
jgi:hypothetical protein